MKLNLGFWQRILLLFLLFIIGICITAGLQILLGMLSSNTLAVSRITIVCQDLLAFVLPAIITALLITRLPADFLQLRTLPNWKLTLLTLFTLVASIPAIEGINELCKLLPWPQFFLDMENAAESATILILGPHNAPNFAIAVMIMAILAGISEEIFFRGALQNLIHSQRGINLAIWLTAIIFAAMHGQAIGFLPRVLLGAFFGYALFLSGSLWLPILCHILNNTLAIITMWAGSETVSTPALCIISAALTAIGIYLMWRQSKSKSNGM